MASKLESCLSEMGLEEHREFILGLARESVEIVSVKGEVTRGCSKFGGPADVPMGFEWPRHEHGPYRFIGQINLAEIPEGTHGLPKSGMLSFFYAHDEKGRTFWADPDYVRVYRFEKVEGLREMEPPAGVRMGATERVKFEIGVDVPGRQCGKAAKSWPLSDEQSDAYWDMRFRLHPSRRYLLGYPLNNSLAYDPTPGSTWRSLLTLSSNDDLEWLWHDDGWLVTFIEEQRLEAGDFSEIKADAG